MRGRRRTQSNHESLHGPQPPLRGGCGKALVRAGREGEVIAFSAPLRDLQQEPTRREIQVLQLVSDGLVNREIGEHLFLSEETVKSHVRHLLAKLQARSRAHAVAVGFRRGMIT